MISMDRIFRLFKFERYGGLRLERGALIHKIDWDFIPIFMVKMFLQKLYFWVKERSSFFCQFESTLQWPRGGGVNATSPLPSRFFQFLSGRGRAFIPINF